MSDAPPLLRSMNISQVSEALRRRVAAALDQSPDRGWRKLAELVGEVGRFKLSPRELEHCSLMVLDSEGSPSLCLLKLMGEKGYTAMDLVDFLQKLGHNDAVQLLKATDKVSGCVPPKLNTTYLSA